MIVFQKPTALRFDGGYVTLGTHPDFDLEQALTFACWVKPGPYVNQGTLLSKGFRAYEPQVQNGRWLLERGPEYRGSDDRIVRDRWMHLAVTFDAAAESGNIRLYIDGVLDRAHDVRTPLARSGEPLLIGVRPGGGEDLLFRGEIAEMALWNTAHGAWQVQQEMNSRPNPLAADLVGWWAMDDAQGTTVSDRGPRGHHGTIQGAVSWIPLTEPITLPTPGQVPLGPQTGVSSAQVPEGTTQLAAAPRVDLPPSGRGGAARAFLDRANLAAQAQVQAQALAGSAQVQQAKQAAAEHLDAAHREAARAMNTARFDAIWFVTGGRIHRTDAQGALTPFRSAVPQTPGGPAPAPAPPVAVLVDARTPWMKTGVQVSPAMRITLAAGGTWSVSPTVVNVGPQGSGALTSGRTGYALPGAPEGALVGRVGDRTFFVGAGATVPGDVAGELELAANDDVASAYGRGYADNAGKVSVTVSAQPWLPTPAADLAVDLERRILFWAAPFTPYTLYRASTDGGDPTPVLQAPGVPVYCVAADTINQRLFYIGEGGRLASVGYDGTGARTLLDLDGPRDRHEWQLAIDADNARVYWTGPLGIWSAALDATDARMVIPPHEAPAPVGVAVDGTAGKVYWVDAELHRVRRAGLDGTGVEDLYDAPWPVRGLALDEPSAELPELKQEVYWSAREERITPRTPGIAGYWPLDEGEGRAVRNRARPSVRSTLGPWGRVRDDLPPRIRPPATAVLLQGDADFIRLPAGSLDPLLDPSWTVEMWVRPRPLPAQGEVRLLSWGDTAADAGLRVSLVDRKPFIRFAGGELAGRTVLAEDRWVHLAFRYDREKQEQAIFVDGAQDALAGGRAPLQGAAGAVAALRGAIGLVTGVHVTARAMTAAEIRASLADPRAADLLDAVAEDPAWADDDAPPVAVRPASVLVFRGAGHVELGTARALGMTGGSFTIEMWLRPDALAGDVSLLGTDEGDGAGRGLHLLTREGKPMLAFWNDDLTAATALTAGEWAHLAFRFDAATREQAIFINGVANARRAAGVAMNGEGRVYLGRRYGISNLRGAVSELRVWSVARTDEQIARNLRGYREQYALRGPVDGSAAPEHLFDFPSEGSMVLASRAGAEHERRLLAYRERQARQARAAADVAAAHADSDQKIGGKQQELEKTSQESAASVAAKNAENEQARAGNRAKLANAQSDANQRVEGARQDAGRKRADAQTQAQQIKDRATADAAAMKNQAQADRDRALAERDRQAASR